MFARHRWLNYCCLPSCGKLLHDIVDMHANVRLWFYVCSPPCLQAWEGKPKQEQEEIIDALRKEG